MPSRPRCVLCAIYRTLGFEVPPEGSLPEGKGVRPEGSGVLPDGNGILTVARGVWVWD